VIGEVNIGTKRGPPIRRTSQLGADAPRAGSRLQRRSFDRLDPDRQLPSECSAPTSHERDRGIALESFRLRDGLLRTPQARGEIGLGQPCVFTGAAKDIAGRRRLPRGEGAPTLQRSPLRVPAWPPTSSAGRQWRQLGGEGERWAADDSHEDLIVSRRCWSDSETPASRARRRRRFRSRSSPSRSARSRAFSKSTSECQN